jgi:ABC-type oligopeptide transport system ATPase subunit
MKPVTAPDWVLKVENLGKVFGNISKHGIADTGPEAGTSKDAISGAIVAAWDVSFEVAAGEALGVVGESGSGKSTVMRCIAGDQTATAGAVKFARRQMNNSIFSRCLPPSVANCVSTRSPWFIKTLPKVST